jgi:hypothetical protein
MYVYTDTGKLQCHLSVVSIRSRVRHMITGLYIRTHFLPVMKATGYQKIYSLPDKLIMRNA